MSEQQFSLLVAEVKAMYFANVAGARTCVARVAKRYDLGVYHHALLYNAAFGRA